MESLPEENEDALIWHQSIVAKFEFEFEAETKLRKKLETKTLSSFGTAKMVELLIFFFPGPLWF